MGEDCETLAAKFSVSREAQDEFALQSHTMAQKAQDDGILAKEIVPVELAPPKFKPIDTDNGIRVAPIEKLAKLRPAFVKPHGTLTAANSSFLTDGAAAVLIMSEDKAKELGCNLKLTCMIICSLDRTFEKSYFLVRHTPWRRSWIETI